MLRTPLRTVPRRFVAPRQPLGVRFVASTTEKRLSVYQSQTTRPFLYASIGLAALFGWTAAILTVGGAGKNKDKLLHAKDKVKEKVKDAAEEVKEVALDAKEALTSSAGASSASSSSSSSSSSEPPASDESSQAAAFNPETGEINWDCPCLGGMADGPCGEDFKQAFSCFVYSEAEPKGVDCVEKFRNMQECFRKHPDIYGNDSDDLDDEDADEYDLISRAEAALALPDEHFLGKVAEAVDEGKPVAK
ncbi:hypothetical protein JCM10212_005486 [Sporobolomyces blumeae]